MVKWIKITNNMFSNEKIKLIESLSNGDTILIILIKLLILAGKNNNNGLIPKNQVKEISISNDILDLLTKLDLIRIKTNSYLIVDFEKFVLLDQDCIIRKKDWRKLRLYILQRDNYTCKYCGNTKGPFEVDHVIPKAKGGTDDENNLVCACMFCNRSKKDKTLKEWRNDMLERGYKIGDLQINPY